MISILLLALYVVVGLPVVLFGSWCGLTIAAEADPEPEILSPVHPSRPWYLFSLIGTVVLWVAFIVGGVILLATYD